MPCHRLHGQDLRASRTAQTLMINRLDDIERRCGSTLRVLHSAARFVLFQASPRSDILNIFSTMPTMLKWLSWRHMAARGYQKLYATESYRCPGTRPSRIVLPMRSIDDALRCALLSRELQGSKEFTIISAILSSFSSQPEPTKVSFRGSGVQATLAVTSLSEVVEACGKGQLV